MSAGADTTLSWAQRAIFYRSTIAIAVNSRGRQPAPDGTEGPAVVSLQHVLRKP
jgi:hypothetical protein